MKRLGLLGSMTVAMVIQASVIPASGAGAAKAPVIGGLNDASGGMESLADPGIAGLASAITTQFPGVKFHLVGHFTEANLSKVNVLFLGVAKSPNSGIKPLSKAEGTAILNFVKGGGTAVLFTDNSTFTANAPAINRSFLRPFGLAATGTLGAGQAITMATGTNPVASGPAGTINQLESYYPGWFSKLGASTLLGTLPANNEPGLAYLPAGSLGAGSGAVIFFADSSLLLDGTRTSDDTTGILNALAVGLP